MQTMMRVDAGDGRAAGAAHARRLVAVGTGVLRYGVVFLLVLFGTFKFFAFEANGIQPMLAHSPLLSWTTPAFGIRGASAVIGIFEIAAGLSMACRRWAPRLSSWGSLMASFAFVVTLSFLFSTPGATDLGGELGGFLMKDIVLLGAALYTAGEAWTAALAARGPATSAPR